MEIVPFSVGVDRIVYRSVGMAACAAAVLLIPDVIVRTNRLGDPLKQLRQVSVIYSRIVRYKIDLINPPSTRIDAPLVAEASGLEK